MATTVTHNRLARLTILLRTTPLAWAWADNKEHEEPAENENLLHVISSSQSSLDVAAGRRQRMCSAHYNRKSFHRLPQC